MKRFFAMLLAMSLVLALCACGDRDSAEDIPAEASDTFISGALQTESEERTPPQEQAPETSTEKKPAGEEPAQEQPNVKTPTLEERFMATWIVDDTTQAAQEFSSDAGTSIDVLREELGQTPACFGMAYIGYYDGTGETDFRQWYEQNASSLIASYPFIHEIDEAHTIGDCGHLYCVIAQYDSSIEVKTIEDDEVLYRAENGDPILVFCNRKGNASIADTAVSVKTADGTKCLWLPTLDPNGFPELLVGDEREALSYDFRAGLTFGYYFNAEDLLREGWLGENAYGLAGDDVLNLKSWNITMWDEEKQTMVDFALTFCPNPSSSGAYDGEISMECFYEGISGTQAEWEGWWRIETEMDQPSRLEIDLMLMRGDDQAHYEDVPYTSESYWVMVHPNGEIVLLVPETGYSALPFLGVGVPAVELRLAMG